jgi:protein SCO1
MVAAMLALLAALGVVLLAHPGRSGTANGFEGSLRPAGIPPQDFRLRDQDGRPVSLRQFRGNVVVLTFLYTHCKDVCPTTATTIRGALDDLGHDVPTLAVSVDPKGDTPAAARQFLLQRRLNGGRMQYLLGSDAQLRPVWKAYGIQPQTSKFDHSAYVLLIDRQGRQRVSFPVEQLTSEALAHDIRRLEAEPAASA